MAKNKRDVDHQVKRAEIEAAALGLFLRQGYEATSMATVAAAAAVAPNTLYWYFDSKDDLLVAVLQHEFQHALAQYALEAHKPVAEQLLWLLDRLEQVSPLISTVHARLSKSESVRRWHAQFHQAFDTLLVAQLAQRGASAVRARVLATVGTFVIEGLLSHPQTPQQRQDVVSWLASVAGGADAPA